MPSSPAPARRTVDRRRGLAGIAAIAAAAVVGGGAWLLAMVIGALLGVVATLTVVGRSAESRGAAGSPRPRCRSIRSPACRRTTG